MIRSVPQPQARKAGEIKLVLVLDSNLIMA